MSSDRPSFARTRTGKDVRVAHRRTPSEMTPLVRDSLAMQHQVYTAQGPYMVPYYQMAPGVVLPVPQQQQPPMPYYHNRTRSHGQGPQQGHARRHSLQVSEAIEQARERTERNGRQSEQRNEAAAPRLDVGSPGGISTSPEFKFPPSPEHRRSGSRSFQLPAQPFTPSRHQHSSSQHQQHHQQHHRRASSNLPPSSNLAVPFVPGHRTGGSFSSVSSIAAFTETQSTRKSLFVPYLTQASVPQLLSDGFLVSGTLRVNRKNRNDAYVSTDVLDADVFICGSKDRNRALDGDLVAIELLDVDEVWDAKREKEEKKRRRDQQDDTRLVETASGELRRRGSLRQRPAHKRNDDVEVEGQSLFLREEEPLSDERRPLYAGHVVAVLERPAGQLFSGTLGLLRPSSQATKERQDAERAEKGQPPLNDRPDRPKIVWFKPTDKCVPLMAIPTEQAPADFVENAAAYADRIFVASVKRWPITSLHPFGTIVEQIGAAGDSSVQQKAIMRDNNFGAHRFSELAQADAAKAVTAMRTAHENGQPAERPVVEGTAVVAGGIRQQAYTLGTNSLSIHTIDLTPFIAEESPLDRELRHKSAGAYMHETTSPLVPDQVIEELGFQKGTKSPAITVTFTFAEGSLEIIETQISLSVVDVVAETAELDELERFRAFGLLLPVDALVCARPGMHTLTDPGLSVMDAINVKVNAAVAQRLLSEYGDQTLLRAKAEPSLAALENLCAALRAADIPFDSTSSATVRDSIAAITDNDLRVAVQIALFKTLEPGKYVVAGTVDPMAYGHYWHGGAAYTHFDKPLFRYADHVVHRQLHSVLGGGSGSDIVRSSNFASELSFRLDCAQNIQLQSEHLKIALKIAQDVGSNGYALYMGRVVQVYESAFDVVIAPLGIEKRVHGDTLPLAKAEFDKQKHVLELTWEPDQDAATYHSAGSLSTAEIAKAAGVDVKKLKLRLEGTTQSIHLFDEVPVLVRTDTTGRVIPSITVRTINPFY